MNILFFGDVIGRPGREALAKILPRLRKKYKADFVIANGENLAHGKGITEKTSRFLLDNGVDLITGGNHIFAREEGFPLFADKKFPVIRPANYNENLPGGSEFILKKGNKKVFVFNLVGKVFMHGEAESPFRKADEILERVKKEKIKAIILDFHAEATSEKKAMGYFMAGRVSAVIGTHTHIQTNDAIILKNKTGYITDVGMVGPFDSVLGVKKEAVLEQFLKDAPFRYEIAEEGEVEVDGVFLRIGKEGKTTKIKIIKEFIHPHT